MKIDFYVLKEGFRTLRENKKVKKSDVKKVAEWRERKRESDKILFIYVPQSCIRNV